MKIIIFTLSLTIDTPVGSSLINLDQSLLPSFPFSDGAVVSSLAPSHPPLSSPHPVFQAIWQIRLPKKLLIFLWRVSRGILPSFDALHFRHLRSYSRCPQCGCGPETIAHALCSCIFSDLIWHELGFSFSAPTDYSVLCDWLLDRFSDFDRATCRLLVIALWKLWWFRNSRLHSGSPLASPVNCHQIRSFHALIEAAPAPPPKSLSGSLPSSSSIAADPVIIYFDGSFLPNDCRGAGRGIAIDSSGTTLATFAVPFPSASSRLMPIRNLFC